MAAIDSEHAGALAALQAWGLTVDAYQYAVQIDASTLERTSTLILFGDTRSHVRLANAGRVCRDRGQGVGDAEGARAL